MRFKTQVGGAFFNPPSQWQRPFSYPHTDHENRKSIGEIRLIHRDHHRLPAATGHPQGIPSKRLQLPLAAQLLSR